MKRTLSIMIALVTALSLLSACAGNAGTSSPSTSQTPEPLVQSAQESETPEPTEPSPSLERTSESLTLDDRKWNYDADNHVYWQLGVAYCSNPAAAEYESLGIYVPAAYMNATENGDGTYTCKIDDTGTINGYTAATAPIVMPVNTAGYAAQKAPTEYNSSGLSNYLDAGFVYVYAGCRGRSNGYDASGNLVYSGGAPWGVTDLKAAVRYLRYNDAILPGDTERIFTFGHSGGGAQSALMGATGDSELYNSYLESIGAAMLDKDGGSISDAICGAMCWCPITSLDAADEAYEWMMGQYSNEGTRADGTWTAALSDDLSEAFADYINALGIKDENGAVLTLTASDAGIYASGSYYAYVKSEIERSLNNFLSDTAFPYTSGGNGFMADGGFAGGGQGGKPADFDGQRPEGGLPEGQLPKGARDDRGGNGGFPGGMRGAKGNAEPVTYNTAQEYIDSLNDDGVWIEYDSATHTASITSVADFVTHCKNASKDVGAFDDLNRSQAENDVFGDDASDALHFDPTMAKLLLDNQEKYAAYSDFDTAYVEAYQEYLTSVDAFGNDSLTRQRMYNPMYYVSESYDGYGTSNVAPHWRIHTGIEQGDTSLTVEINLALALKQNSSVQDVDFETVWGQGHTMAERTGNAASNFVDWVNACLK